MPVFKNSLRITPVSDKLNQNLHLGYVGNNFRKDIIIGLRFGGKYTSIRVENTANAADFYRFAVSIISKNVQVQSAEILLYLNGFPLPNSGAYKLADLGIVEGSCLECFLAVIGGMPVTPERQEDSIQMAKVQLGQCTQKLQSMKASIKAMVGHVSLDLLRTENSRNLGLATGIQGILSSKGHRANEAVSGIGTPGVEREGQQAELGDLKEVVGSAQHLHPGADNRNVCWGGLKEGLVLLAELSHVVLAMGGAWEEICESGCDKTALNEHDSCKIERQPEDSAPNQGGNEQTWAPFNEDEDDLEIFSALFTDIDTDKNGEISLSELEAALARFKDNTVLSSAVTSLMKDRSKRIDFDFFKKFFGELPRIRGERVRWAASLRLEAELARHLMLGDVSDGLKGLKSMSDAETDQHINDVCSRFSAQLPAILKSGLDALKRSTCTNAKEFINTKFSLDGAFVGNFADLQNFHDGPEKLLGAPNPQVGAGIRREHCERPNACKLFTTPNYNITTSPKDEYEFVFEPHDSIEYPHTPSDKEKWKNDFKAIWKGDFGREVVLLKHFMDTEYAKKAKLKQEEVGSLRLYSGPMYVLYNAVLRKHPNDIFLSLEDNRYETTIFCITSGIVKLSRLSKIPSNRRLYRGLGGMILPDQFLQEKSGFRGGVEWGLMSTTRNKEVAMQYSGADKQRGSVFEIVPGRIDIGAELSWLSQYPGEEEYLFPPLSCLEVIDEPQVQGPVVVFPLRVNINLKGLTLEQLVERRKDLHLAMVKNLK